MKKLFEKLKKRPFLCLLLVILGIVTFTAIKPNLYVLGWDNFSSYFNLPSNIFKTFFATWREYRGLGVASDSESVDIFRQVFSFILSPFMPEAMLEQVYILISLNLGIILMYVFAGLILKNNVEDKYRKYDDFFAFLCSFFYLFNLNTVATFFFPMMMYISRFFTIPLLFIIFYDIASSKVLSIRKIILYIVSIFFASGSYITGTILITILGALFIFSFSLKNKKHFFISLLFFLLLNAFWLLPFFNYTIQKSKLIPLAPTFIDANETQLNKPKSYFDLQKQLTLYSNFFDTKTTDILSGKQVPLSTFGAVFNQPRVRYLLLIFPLLYLSGCFLIIFKKNQFKGLFFIPAIISVFLFLSLNEFSPIGFIYTFLSRHLPYFEVLFRFGDTKFHAFINFAGSLSAGIAVIWIVEKVRNNVIKFFIGLYFLFTLFLFSGYFKGKLIASFIYNNIPNAYFQIADIVNKDTDSFRVLHLPFDKKVYWKSYAWGSIGSSFLNFMLNHPLIDKTFEPASMENAYLDNRIWDLVANTQSIQNEKLKRQQTEKFANLLNKVGIKYIILDNSVQADVDSRGMTFWGTFNGADSKQMIQNLTDFGYVKNTQIFSIDLRDGYPYINDLDQVKKNLLNKNPVYQIQLVELNSFQKKVQFLSAGTHLDPEFNNVFETDLTDANTHWIQNSLDSSYSVYPFRRRDLSLENSNSGYSLRLAVNHTGSAIIRLPQEATIQDDQIINYVDAYVSRNKNMMEITLFARRLPLINDLNESEKIASFDVPYIDSQRVTQTNSYLSDWKIAGDQSIGDYRLKLSDSILPIPAHLKDQSELIGTVPVKGKNIPVTLLQYSKTNDIDPQLFSLTTPVNCFNDSLKDAKGQVENKNGITVSSQNQSTCFFYSLDKNINPSVNYIEIGFDINGISQDLDQQYHALVSTSKPNLQKFITQLPKPNVISTCIRERFVDDCFNDHQYMNVGNLKSIFIQSGKTITGLEDLILLLSAKNTGFQLQNIHINNMKLYSFKKIYDQNIPLNSNVSEQKIISLDKTDTISVFFPKIIGNNSYHTDISQEGLQLANKACDKENGYRTFRILNDSTLISYINNCYTNLSFTQNTTGNSTYFWTTSYNLLSGKYPIIQDTDKLNTYLDEVVSVYQNYPKVPDFKQFQDPETVVDPSKSTRNNIKNTIGQLDNQNAYGYFDVINDNPNNQSNQVSLQHDSENEGIMAVQGFDSQPIPTQWKNLSIDFGQVNQSFSVPTSYTFDQILPSLWKVNVSMKDKGKYLLFFNESFDKQWRLIGDKSIIKPNRCDGYANCFIVQNNEGQKDTTYYLFYLPELLSLTGWIITIISVVVFMRTLKFSSQPS